MNFSDIPQLTPPGRYMVNVGWSYLEDWLKDMSEGAKLELQPDFQRAHVWNPNQQRRYVEFILRGGRSARTLYWNCSTWDNRMDTPLQLVDGLQRLTAVREFLGDRLAVFGRFFGEFTGKLRLAGPDFVMNVNNLPDRSAVLQWYLDLNDGGVQHTEEEIVRVRKLLAEEQPKEEDDENNS